MGLNLLPKICAWLHIHPLHQNHAYTDLSPMSLGKFLRSSIWNAVSWATILNLPWIKLNSQPSRCAFFQCVRLSASEIPLSSLLCLFCSENTCLLLTCGFCCLPSLFPIARESMGDSLVLCDWVSSHLSNRNYLICSWLCGSGHHTGEQRWLSRLPDKWGFFTHKWPLPRTAPRRTAGTTWRGPVYRNLPPFLACFLLPPQAGSLRIPPFLQGIWTSSVGAQHYKQNKVK